MRSKIFVIPFAGGGAASFIGWENSDSYNRCIFLDFYDSSIHNELECDHNAYADYAEEYICNYISANDIDSYVIWGHSMGSLIAYDVCKRIIKKGFLKPGILIMTSTEAPKCIDKKKIKELLSDQRKFNSYVMDMGLLNEKVLKSRFFDKFYKKKLIKDYRVILSYPESEKEKINQKAFVINGKGDHICLEDSMKNWSQYFTELPKYKLVEGNHFFIFDKQFDPQQILGEYDY